MLSLCIAVLSILLSGSIVAFVSREPKGDDKNTPPSLPPRKTQNTSVPIRKKTEVSSQSSGITNNLGPRGIRPDQFPCCPFCKQRNRAGQPQVIFWVAKEGWYRCTRDHTFKRNGKPL